MGIHRNMTNVIRILNEESGKALNEFTDYLDVSRTVLQKYLFGEENTRAAAIKQVSDILDVDASFLASGVFCRDQITLLLGLLKLLKLLAAVAPRQRVRFAQLLLEVMLRMNGAAMTPMPSHNISFTEALTFRSPMRVSAIRVYRHSFGWISYPVCPRCLIAMEREYQSYCDRCGQALQWKHLKEAAIIRSKE